MQLFIDIETVPQFWSDQNGIVNLPGEITELYGKKFKSQILSLQSEINDHPDRIPENVISFQEALNEHFKMNAALFAEFGKIVCISMGFISKDELHVKTLAGRDEKNLLQDAKQIMDKAISIVAHIGLDFVFPFLIRRMMIHGIELPKVLNIADKKPWEINLEDTVKMWSATQWNYKSSLALIAECFNLPSPKQNMDGSKVAEVYYSMFDVPASDLPFDKEQEVLDKIKYYCQGDLLTLVNIYQKMKYKSAFLDESKILFK